MSCIHRSRCDGCQREDDQPAGWVVVDNHGIDVSGFVDVPKPWHFCGLVCLSAFLDRHGQERQSLKSVGGATKEMLRFKAGKLTEWLMAQEGRKVDVKWERGMFEINDAGAWVRYEPTTGQRVTVTIDDAFGVDAPVRTP
jgi:hypothetical protein